MSLCPRPSRSVEIADGYVGAAATKSVMLGDADPGHGAVLRAFRDRASLWMVAFLVLTAVTFSLFGFIIGLWADEL